MKIIYIKWQTTCKFTPQFILIVVILILQTVQWEEIALRLANVPLDYVVGMLNIQVIKIIINIVKISIFTKATIRTLVEQLQHPMHLLSNFCYGPFLIMLNAYQVHLALPQLHIITHRMTQGFWQIHSIMNSITHINAIRIK